MEKQALAKPTPVVTHVLSQRNMQWYLGTQVISLTGMMLRQAVLSLLMIDLVGVKNAPPLVGMIWALNVLPGTIMGIFAGMMVDHFDKRRILQTTAVLGIIQGLILVYITRGRDMHNLPEHIAIWKIMSVMLFTGITNAIDGICRNAIVADAVLHEENKSMGSIIFSCLYTFGMVLGNGLAGWLVENIGYSNTFILNASSFLFLIIGLSQMSFKHNKTKKKDHGVFEGALHRIKIGILYTFTHKGIRICIEAKFIRVMPFPNPMTGNQNQNINGTSSSFLNSTPAGK